MKNFSKNSLVIFSILFLDLLSLEPLNSATYDFAFVDLLGNLKIVSVPGKASKTIFEKGLKFDGSSVSGCSNITSSDMHLAPDINSVRALPLSIFKRRHFFVMCDTALSETEPNLADSRQFLKQSLRNLEKNNLTFVCGAELEFYIFDKDGNVIDSNDYFSPNIKSNLNAFVDVLFNFFDECNLNIVKFHHEVGNGQFEFVVGHDNALKTADNIVFLKYLISLVADRFEFKISYKPKPIFGINGSGMHIHFSVFDFTNKSNKFCNLQKDYFLSDYARSFIAGVLNNVRDLDIFYNSVENSFKRLVPGYEAPNLVCAGVKNRSALVRIPQVNADEPLAVRAEIRCPDPMANPYLLLSGLIVSGLNGIEQNLSLSLIEKNLFKLSIDEVKQMGIKYLPVNIQEALNCFKNSHFVKQNIPSALTNQIINLKSKEVHELAVSIN